jgi:hypothetical protein
MKAIFIPIIFGILTYVAIAAGSWLILGFALVPLNESISILIPIFLVPVPLFLSGFIAAKWTRSNYRSRRIIFGVVSALIGLLVISIPLKLIQWTGTDELWFLLVILIGAMSIALFGAFIGTRKPYAL